MLKASKFISIHLTNHCPVRCNESLVITWYTYRSAISLHKKKSLYRSLTIPPQYRACQTFSSNTFVSNHFISWMHFIIEIIAISIGWLDVKRSLVYIYSWSNKSHIYAIIRKGRNELTACYHRLSSHKHYLQFITAFVARLQLATKWIIFFIFLFSSLQVENKKKEVMKIA